MNTLTYTDMLLGKILSEPDASPWQRCRITVASRSRCHCIRYTRHGKGFWETDTTIVTGYVLKRNAEVFRPVYQFMRNKRLEGVLNTIKDRIGNGQRGGGRFMMRLRQNLARHAMLGLPLPVAVITKIGAYV